MSEIICLLEDFDKKDSLVWTIYTSIDLGSDSIRLTGVASPGVVHGKEFDSIDTYDCLADTNIGSDKIF